MRLTASGPRDGIGSYAPLPGAAHGPGSVRGGATLPLLMFLRSPSGRTPPLYAALSRRCPSGSRPGASSAAHCRYLDGRPARQAHKTLSLIATALRGEVEWLLLAT